ncbi:MAG: hypothetical protein IPK82_30555 [Polyangiaceae bacterium]|nr:hypothetical protein [Polyangiaceae bacterium]
MTNVAKDMPTADVAKAPSPASYDFSDDTNTAPESATPSMPAPPASVVKARKQAHQSAVEALH